MRRRTEVAIFALATAQLLLAWSLVLPQLVALEAGAEAAAPGPVPAVAPPSTPAPPLASEAEEPAAVPEELGPTVPHA